MTLRSNDVTGSEDQRAVEDGPPPTPPTPQEPRTIREVLKEPLPRDEERADRVGLAPNDAPASRFSAYRSFVSHPAYVKIAPWIALLQRIRILLTVVGILLTIATLTFSILGYLQGRKQYDLSIQPALQIDTSNFVPKQSRYFSLHNYAMSGDAQNVRFACTQVAADESELNSPLVASATRFELPRGALSPPFLIKDNCTKSEGTSGIDDQSRDQQVLLLFFACYDDELAKPHAVVNVRVMNSKSNAVTWLRLDTPLGAQVILAARTTCGVDPKQI